MISELSINKSREHIYLHDYIVNSGTDSNCNRSAILAISISLEIDEK